MHTLITGSPGAGKSTLIRRVLAELNVPVLGYETRKEDALAREPFGSPIYLYSIGVPHTRSEDNLLGWCSNQRPLPRKEVFDRYASSLSELAGRKGIICMDEIGTMELCSQHFCDAVVSLLDGDTPVIAAVKPKDRPFLNEVRSHPNCRLFALTEENREDLFPQVLAFVKEQLAHRSC